ncbi:MAG: hypothetical protein JO062_17705 [Bryobacterales bacterium]|nr:hypothetical protein [Bryobacterales bacterium]
MSVVKLQRRGPIGECGECDPDLVSEAEYAARTGRRKHNGRSPVEHPNGVCAPASANPITSRTRSFVDSITSTGSSQN